MLETLGGFQNMIPEPEKWDRPEGEVEAIARDIVEWSDLYAFHWNPDLDDFNNKSHDLPDWCSDYQYRRGKEDYYKEVLAYLKEKVNCSDDQLDQLTNAIKVSFIKSDSDNVNLICMFPVRLRVLRNPKFASSFDFNKEYEFTIAVRNHYEGTVSKTITRKIEISRNSDSLSECLLTEDFFLRESEEVRLYFSQCSEDEKKAVTIGQSSWMTLRELISENSKTIGLYNPKKSDEVVILVEYDLPQKQITGFFCEEKKLSRNEDISSYEIFENDTISLFSSGENKREDSDGFEFLATGTNNSNGDTRLLIGVDQVKANSADTHNPRISLKSFEENNLWDEKEYNNGEDSFSAFNKAEGKFPSTGSQDEHFENAALQKNYELDNILSDVNLSTPILESTPASCKVRKRSHRDSNDKNNQLEYGQENVCGSFVKNKNNNGQKSRICEVSSITSNKGENVVGVKHLNSEPSAPSSKHGKASEISASEQREESMSSPRNVDENKCSPDVDYVSLEESEEENETMFLSMLNNMLQGAEACRSIRSRNWKEIKRDNFDPFLLIVPKDESCQVSEEVMNLLHVHFIEYNIITDIIKMETTFSENPVYLSFENPSTAKVFYRLFRDWAAVVKLAKMNPAHLSLLESPPTDERPAGHLQFTNTNTSETLEYQPKDEKARERIKWLFNRFKKKAFERLPSWKWECEEKRALLYEYLQNVCPDSLILIKNSVFSISRFHHNDGKLQKVSMRLIISKKGIGFIGVRKREEIPQCIKNMLNFDEERNILLMDGVLRGVPVSAEKFVLTMLGDTYRRISVFDFRNILTRRAFGDFLDTISLFNYISNCEVSLANYLLRIFSSCSDFNRLVLGCDVKVDEFSNKDGSVSISTNPFEKWKGGRKGSGTRKNSDERLSLNFNFKNHNIGSYTRHQDTVDVTLNDSKHIKYTFSKASVARLFSEFCKYLLERNRILTDIYELSKAQQSLDNNEMNRYELLSHLISVLPNDCAILARRDIHIKCSKTLNEYVPAHFNLICSRVVTEHRDLSVCYYMDLTSATKMKMLDAYEAEIHLEVGNSCSVENEITFATVRSKSVADYCSFVNLICEILKIRGIKNGLEFQRHLSSEIVLTKSGIRIARTKQEEKLEKIELIRRKEEIKEKKKREKMERKAASKKKKDKVWK